LEEVKNIIDSRFEMIDYASRYEFESALERLLSGREANLEVI